MASLKSTQARLLCRIGADLAQNEYSTQEQSLACLKTASGDGSWKLRRGANTIGRDASCQVYLDIPEIQQKKLVSGVHAYIIVQAGRYRLFDGSLDGRPSINGTYVNLQGVPRRLRVERWRPNPVSCPKAGSTQPGSTRRGHFSFPTGLQLMDLLDLNTLLFVGKWAFIGIVYLIMIIMTIAVRREMASHSIEQTPSGQLAPGRLQVIVNGSDRLNLPGKLLSLTPLSTLGAAADNDIILADQYVSAHHARLTWDGSCWWVEDLGSANGTTIDHNRCLPHNPQRVPSGARLGLGDMVLEMIEV